MALSSCLLLTLIILALLLSGVHRIFAVNLESLMFEYHWLDHLHKQIEGHFILADLYSPRPDSESMEDILKYAKHFHFYENEFCQESSSLPLLNPHYPEKFDLSELRQKYPYGDISLSTDDEYIIVVHILSEPYNSDTYFDMIELFLQHLHRVEDISDATIVFVLSDSTHQSDLQALTNKYFPKSHFLNFFLDEYFSTLKTKNIFNSLKKVAVLDFFFRYLSKFGISTDNILYLTQFTLPSPDLAQFSKEVLPTHQNNSAYIITFIPGGSHFNCDLYKNAIYGRGICSGQGPTFFHSDTYLLDDYSHIHLETFLINRKAYEHVLLFFMSNSDASFESIVNSAIDYFSAHFRITSPCRPRVYSLSKPQSNISPLLPNFKDPIYSFKWFYSHHISNSQFVTLGTFRHSSVIYANREVEIQCASSSIPSPLPVEFYKGLHLSYMKPPDPFPTYFEDIKSFAPRPILPPRKYWADIYGSFFGGWNLDAYPKTLRESFIIPDPNTLFPVWLSPYLNELPISFRPVCETIPPHPSGFHQSLNHLYDLPQLFDPSYFVSLSLFHRYALDDRYPNSPFQSRIRNAQSCQNSTVVHIQPNTVDFTAINAFLGSLSNHHFRCTRAVWTILSPYSPPTLLFNSELCQPEGPNPSFCFGLYNQSTPSHILEFPQD